MKPRPVEYAAAALHAHSSAGAAAVDDEDVVRLRRQLQAAGYDGERHELRPLHSLSALPTHKQL